MQMISDIDRAFPGYQAVPFPEVQRFMDKPWFEEEAILIQSGALYKEYGDSAYLIPQHRFLSDVVRVTFEIDVLEDEEKTPEDYAEEAWAFLTEASVVAACVHAPDGIEAAQIEKA